MKYNAFSAGQELPDEEILATSQKDARKKHKSMLEARGYAVALSPASEEVWAVKDGHEYVFYGYVED